VEDSAGNLVSTDSSSVTIAIGAGSPSTTLHGTLTVAASGGIATFNTLTIGKVGSGYTLTAADAGLTGATSNSFNILAGTAALLVFTAQPTNTTAGQIIDGASGVQVAVEDALGNLVSTDSSSVTVAIGTGSPSTTLNGTTTVAA